MSLPKEVQKLSDLLAFLPGIGPKMSSRLALYLSVGGKSLGSKLSHSIDEVVNNIRPCSKCSNITTGDLCEICSSSERNLGIIVVVEDSLDLYNIESTGEFNGLYHVLGGLISPVNGVGPNDINLSQFINRIKNLDSCEIVIALNPTLEGDSTSMYLKNEISKLNKGFSVSRLAKGIPSGGDIEFASSQTLIESFKSRSGF